MMQTNDAVASAPKLVVMRAVACDGANAYLTAFDGTLTAIKCRAQ